MATVKEHRMLTRDGKNVCWIVWNCQMMRSGVLVLVGLIAKASSSDNKIKIVIHVILDSIKGFFSADESLISLLRKARKPLSYTNKNGPTLCKQLQRRHANKNTNNDVPADLKQAAKA